MTTYTLLQLNEMIQRAVADALPQAFWMTAELNSAQDRGHFYGEVVQKDEAGHTLAQARVTCWRNQFSYVQQKFYAATGSVLRAGLQVMILVKASFHPAFGFSYNIQDIEPSYTLGDAERRRREILDALQREGIMRENATIPLPRIIQRIAVISSATAAGYGDFVNQLVANSHRLRFMPTLFDSLMQGNGVEMSVMAALEQIAERQEEFDAVVIIRGGGSTTDLDCFDNYNLAHAIALYPLPVFTGIGHERDEVVLDYVAHTRLKTPTAVAAFMVEHNHRELMLLDDINLRVAQSARLTLERGTTRLIQIEQSIPLYYARVREREDNRLSRYSDRMRNAWTLRYERERNRFTTIERQMYALDPMRVLERGYSMALSGGQLLTDSANIEAGDEITIKFAKGAIITKCLKKMN